MTMPKKIWAGADEGWRYWHYDFVEGDDEDYEVEYIRRDAIDVEGLAEAAVKWLESIEWMFSPLGRVLTKQHLADNFNRALEEE